MLNCLSTGNLQPRTVENNTSGTLRSKSSPNRDNHLAKYLPSAANLLELKIEKNICKISHFNVVVHHLMIRKSFECLPWALFYALRRLFYDNFAKRMKLCKERVDKVIFAFKSHPSSISYFHLSTHIHRPKAPSIGRTTHRVYSFVLRDRYG